MGERLHGDRGFVMSDANEYRQFAEQCFKLADSQSDPHIVQIFTEDRRELVATIRAIPAYRMNLTGDTLMTFKERTSGSPEAVSRWFYPGHLAGLAFVYPEDQQ